MVQSMSVGGESSRRTRSKERVSETGNELNKFLTVRERVCYDTHPLRGREALSTEDATATSFCNERIATGACTWLAFLAPFGGALVCVSTWSTLTSGHTEIVCGRRSKAKCAFMVKPGFDLVEDERDTCDGLWVLLWRHRWA